MRCHHRLAIALGIVIGTGLTFASSVGAARTDRTPSKAQVKSANGVLPPRPIWSTKTNALVSETELVEALAKAKVVILGEIHDNPEHHQRRAALVNAIMAHRKELRGAMKPPAAVFEHFKRDQQSALTAAEKRSRDGGGAPDVDTFLEAMNWQASGWSRPESFRPLFGAVLAAGLPLCAGDPSNNLIKAVAKTGDQAMSARLKDRLGLNVALDPQLTNASLAEIDAAHCGMIPKKNLQSMALAQRLRDATLAEATLTAATRHGAALLFTGNVHARLDRGVPWYLRNRGLNDIVSVQFLEAMNEGSGNPKLRVERSPSGQPVADYVVLTPKRTGPDRCQKLRHHFRNKGG